MTAASAAWGQSAADKATARQLATQGIQFYQQGKHAEALDLLQRAEQLYDAPVHLIYIARTQSALSKLVEASETYRRLVRTDLPAGAPPAFKDAVADAQKELQQLEPKIPSLRIDVSPADIKGLQLKLDGEVVSSVVIGINRPTNPGKHTVEAAAANFDTATANVELSPAGKQTVTLQMRPRPGAPAPVAVGAGATTVLPPTVETGGTAAPVGAAPQTVPVEPAVPFDKPPQIVLGVRFTAVVPGGKLRLGGADATSEAINGVNNQEANLHDRFGSGVGFWLSAGYRFPLGKQLALTPAVAYEGSWFDKGPYYAQTVENIIQKYAYGTVGGTSSVLQITPIARSVLLGASIEFPRAQHSWSPTFYGEFYIIPYHEIKTTGTITTGSNNCQLSDSYTGAGAKFGAGVLLPASKILRLGGGLGIIVASTSNRVYWDTCARGTGGNVATVGIASTNLDLSNGSKIHTIAGLNLGGDFMIGL